ncbi:hypothetical protein BJ508DRAFT_312956 [Ascobolus immersus RN42]|uniref:BTB domain-containing protein n=1 Tax=Ascobolus immersus RN42 TaxID=1160509 RepID=A0A3N4HN13_ASCIM|nr:hypothetical protein BJ508DRAFT_312956 [Ascobolus immersus RN42]
MNSVAPSSQSAQKASSKRLREEDDTEKQLPTKKRTREGKTSEVEQLPIAADLFTSTVVRIYTYDPRDPDETIRCIRGSSRPGIEKPYVVHRPLLERSSEFFVRQLALLDEHAALEPTDQSILVNNKTQQMLIKPKVEADVQQAENTENDETRAHAVSLLSSRDQGIFDSIYIPSRFIPSQAAFRAFIEFAHTGIDYEYESSPPFGTGGPVLEHHMRVYQLARTLHSQNLQKRAALNFHKLLGLRVLNAGLAAALVRASFKLLDSPDGANASYSLNLSTDKEEMDCIQEIILSFVASRLNQLREDSDDMLNLFRENKHFAEYIFHKAPDATSEWQAAPPVFS